MSAAVLPGRTIGVLGGGQLGRMLGQAARRLGYGVVVWSPEPDVPAAAVADQLVRSPYDDEAAARGFAESVDVVTVEFENVPAALVERLAAWRPVRPSARVLRLTQHRGREKAFVRGAGLPRAPYRDVPDAAALDAALGAIGYPAVLKTAGFGYDGKGQARLLGAADLAAAEALLVQGPCLLERLVPLALELSVVAARGVDGAVRTFPVFENAHADHVLDVTVVPARVSAALAARAEALAVRVAEALGLEGLACVECFLDEAGELLINEIAPRPHNSGHVSLEACETDQFEQQLRAVCGLPLGSTALRSPGAMANLLGDLWQSGTPAWSRVLARPGLHLHLYGKREPRPGRKMGHLTQLAADPDAAERGVRAARAALRSQPGAGVRGDGRHAGDASASHAG
jgi:5-(carboxyamino)imidazole ribonucleotide synthase